MVGQQRSPGLIWAVAPLAAVVLVAWLLLARGAFYGAWAQDIFIPLGGVVHIQHGQLPHRGFETPVGALYYFVHYLPTLVAPLSARTVVWASVIVGVTATGLAAFLGRGRLPGWAAALFALYVGLLAISPRQLGEILTFVTNNASYNRWSWALTAVLALVVGLPPRGGGGRAATRDGVVAGLLLAALFFIKVTYFAAGVGLVAVAAVTVRRADALRMAGTAAVATAAVLALVQLTTGLVGAYLADLRAAASVQPSTLRPQVAYMLAVAFAPGGLLVLVLGLVAAPSSGGLWERFSPLAMALATFGSGLAIAIQNHPEPENPMLPVAALIAWFAARRSAEDEERRFASGPMALVAPAAVAGLVLIPLSQDLGASLWTFVAPTASGPETAWLRATRLADLRLAEDGVGGGSEPDNLLNDVEWAAVLGDGAALLGRHLDGSPNAEVLPLTWSNPWPVLLGLPPVRHELAWWDSNRTFNGEVKPDPSFLRAVDFVLIPKRYYNYEATAAMREAYAPTLQQQFRPVEETRHWTLLARRACAAGEPC